MPLQRANIEKRSNLAEIGRRHARHRYACPKCGQVVRGNGGRSSHARMHARKEAAREG